MEFAYALCGNAQMKKYQVNETMATAGVPVRIPTSSGTGVVLASTTDAQDLVGVTADTATYVTAQQTDGTSAERLVSVNINPTAVWQCLMSGGATEGTALTLYDVTTASTDGLTVTTGDSWSNFDEGVAWGYSGANAGQARKITSASATAATVTVAFDYDTASGDNFLRAPYWPAQTTNVQLTTNLYQADASIVVGTGAHFTVVEMILNHIGAEGRTKSYVLIYARDHVFGHRPT